MVEIIPTDFVFRSKDSELPMTLFYAFSDSLLLTPLCCDDIHDVTPRVSALAGCDRLVSEPLVIENCAFIVRASKAGVSLVEGEERDYPGFNGGYGIKSSLISLNHGSFDVIVGMDWLSKRKFVIVCHEKVVRIPLEGDEILRVHGERTQGVVKTLVNTKTRVSYDLVIFREEHQCRLLRREAWSSFEVSVGITEEGEVVLGTFLRADKLFYNLGECIGSTCRKGIVPILMILRKCDRITMDFIGKFHRFQDRSGRIYIDEIISRNGILVTIKSDLDGGFTCGLVIVVKVFRERYGFELLVSILKLVVYHSSIYCDPFEMFTGRTRLTVKVVLKRKSLIQQRSSKELCGYETYVRPFEILERIGPVAYRLRLPEELSGVHDTFHVSNLKKCLAGASLHVPLNEIKVDKTLRFIEEPVEILDREIRILKRSKISLVKVCWNSKRGPEFTWEREDYMKSKYPQFDNGKEWRIACNATSIVGLLSVKHFLEMWHMEMNSDRLEWVLWYAPWLSDQLEWICGMLHGLVINWSSSVIEMSRNRVNVDFLNDSYIRYALTKNPTIYVSLIEKFWQTITVRTVDNRDQEIIVTVDGKEFTIIEASVRRHLQQM
ncbi:hypothetical protein Tco_0000329 [Tanacetum coccineum]